MTFRPGKHVGHAHRDDERTPTDAEYALANARCREEFLLRMSHELRTPLNAVIGFSRVLESNKAGNQRPEDIEMLQRVRAGGEQLLRVVEYLLSREAERFEGGPGEGFAREP